MESFVGIAIERLGVEQKTVPFEHHRARHPRQQGPAHSSSNMALRDRIELNLFFMVASRCW